MAEEQKTTEQDSKNKEQDSNNADKQDLNAPKNDGKTFDADYVEKLRKEAAESRVKLKEFEKAQEENTKKALEEQGKHKELYEQTSAKFNELQKSYDELVKELEIYRDRDEKEKKEILKSLPEALKETAKSLKLDAVKALKADWENATKPPANSPNSNIGAAGAAQDTGATSLLGLIKKQYGV